jgi:hypothetical protein
MAGSAVEVEAVVDLGGQAAGEREPASRSRVAAKPENAPPMPGLANNGLVRVARRSVRPFHKIAEQLLLLGCSQRMLAGRSRRAVRRCGRALPNLVCGRCLNDRLLRARAGIGNSS